MFKNLKCAAVFLSLIFCLSLITFGQGTTGDIEGTITDSTGALIPGAAIEVVSFGQTTGFHITITCDDKGYFILPSVPPGTYRVTVSAKGFADKITDIIVVIDNATIIREFLEPARPEIVINVSGETSVQVDPGGTKIDTNVTKLLIEALPGTSLASTLELAPNVRSESLDGSYQIDGASGAENVFVIDGQEVTNFRTGLLTGNNDLRRELLQEVQIKSTGFEAEYGGATGGVINAVTVGGNNDWRGNFGFNFISQKLRGNPSPSLVRYGFNEGEFEYFDPKKDAGFTYYPSASLSGPIFKEKLWFLVTHAPQFSDLSRTIDYYDTITPGRSAIETINYDDYLLRTEETLFRLDAQPTSKLRLFGTFLHNPFIVKGALPSTTEGLSGSPQQFDFGGSTGELRGAELLALRGGRQNSNIVNGQATWVPADHLVFNFRFGRSFSNEKLDSYGIPRTTRFFCHFNYVPVEGANCTQGFQNISSNNTTDYDVSTRTTFDADASLFGINAAGRHNFKFGYQLNRLFNTVSEGYLDLGFVVLYYTRSLENLIGLPSTPGNLGSGILVRLGETGDASSKNQAIYGQDSWQIRNRLTLNLGIRFESEVVPSFGDEATTKAVEFGWGEKIAPRFGVAFDLTGDGKTKLFGSYGWFYDRFKYQLPRAYFGGLKIYRDYFEILPGRGAAYTNYTFQNILGNDPDTITGNCPITGGSGWSVCQRNSSPIPFNLIDADIFTTGGVDPDIKAMRQSEYTIGVERELGNNFVLAGRFTHKQLDRAIEDATVFNDQGSQAVIIGNPGQGLVCEVSTSTDLPCTIAERTYDVLEFRIDKRAKKFFFSANYAYSRLFGNHSGLRNPLLGYSSPNINPDFDLTILEYNADGTPNNGRLETDRPHVFKAYGSYRFDWKGNKTHRTAVSAFTTIQSGTPLTTFYTLLHPGYGHSILNGRGDLGRTETYSQTDLKITHQYRFGRDNRFTLEPFIEVNNLFNEKNVLRRQTRISFTTFRASQLTDNGCTTCFDSDAIADTIVHLGGIRQYVLNYLNAEGISNIGQRNDYDQPTSFQSPRGMRLGFRFFF